MYIFKDCEQKAIQSTYDNDTKLENFKVEIFDLLGKKLFESYNLKIIDVSNYDKGTYLLKVSSGYNSNSKLFIKK